MFDRVLNLSLAFEDISFKSNTNYHFVWEITRETQYLKEKHQTAYELKLNWWVAVEVDVYFR